MQVTPDCVGATGRLVKLETAKKALAHFDKQHQTHFAEVSAEIDQNSILLRGMATDLQYIFSHSRFAYMHMLTAN